MNPLISVVTPSFNQGSFIERTIQSVLKQNIPQIDYVITDGGSTDDTLEILHRYASQLRWISESDKGQSHAVNKGISMTKGEIIAWINSDDIYYPDALEEVCRIFAKFPEIDVIYGNADHIDADDKIIEKYYTEAWDINRLKDVCFLSQPAVFFRRSIIDRFGMLNENLQYCMDYEYWLRLAFGGARFHFLEKTLAGSRLHENTKTLGSRVAAHHEINTMLKTILGKVPNRWLSNYAHAYVESNNKYSRNDPKTLRQLALQTIAAAFRWNKSANPTLLFMTVGWLIKSIART